MPHKILVVGDVNIDESWLVNPVPLGSTSQAHGGVAPEKVSVKLKTRVLGSAATIARSVYVADSTIEIALAGAWSKDLDRPEELIPEIDPTAGSTRFTFHRIADLPSTRTITRIYSRDQKKFVLQKRYDQDFKAKEINLPIDGLVKAIGEVAVVIVGDYNYGLLDIPGVQELLKQYGCKPFILRSKRRIDGPILRAVPWTILCPNRQDLVQMVGAKYPVGTAMRRIHFHMDKRSVDRWMVHPEGLEALKKLSDEFSDRSFLWKVDREGAMLLRPDKKIVCFPLAEHFDTKKLQAGTVAAQSKALYGIGAGDTLMASMAIQLVRGATTTDGIPPEAVKFGVKRATAFCRVAQDLTRKSGWFGTTMEIDAADTDKVDVLEVLDFPLELKKECESHLDSVTYPTMLEQEQLFIDRARWFLNDFLTVDKDLGGEILRLKSQIQAYLDAKQHERPFVAAICGGPGAGKSFLTRAFARELNCEFESSNAAQWTDVQELFWICERVRTAHAKRLPVLVFIDEVDSDVQGQKVYGKLLAPLWDASYQLNGDERILGLPVVFLLAGSTASWAKREALLADQHPLGEEKLKDLVSRLSVSPIEINREKSWQADAVYIAADALQRRFAQLEFVEKNVLKLFAEAKCLHGPRSISRAIGMIDRLEAEEKLTAKDLKWSDSEIALHLAVGDSWQEWLCENKRRKDGLKEEDFIRLV